MNLWRFCQVYVKIKPYGGVDDPMLNEEDELITHHIEMLKACQCMGGHTKVFYFDLLNKNYNKN